MDDVRCGDRKLFVCHLEDETIQVTSKKTEANGVEKIEKYQWSRKWSRGMGDDNLADTLLPEDVPRLPSFFSSLVSRRYAFHLQIVLKIKRGVSSKPILLRIPIQIVHASVEKHPAGPSDWEVEFSDDLRAPAYVP